MKTQQQCASKSGSGVFDVRCDLKAGHVGDHENHETGGAWRTVPVAGGKSGARVTPILLK